MKKLKKYTALTLCLLLVFTCFPLSHAKAAYKPPFDINSEVVYLINTDTGDVLYEQNADKQMYPASLTKIMTAIVAIEMVPDPESVMVTAPAYIYDEFVGLGVSHADIRKNETVSMLDLLYALLLPSACEAASIIADYLGEGNIYAFVDRMNAKAAELGAVNTHFTGAHGLFNANEVTTAKDMYLITKYAMELPLFAKIVDTTIYYMPDVPRYAPGQYIIQNTNWLLRKDTEYYNEYVHGIKTGSLPEVGKNLISSASKDGYNYMLITMGAPDTYEDGTTWKTAAFEDANRFYDWAFSSFSLQPVIQKNEIVSEVKVALGKDVDYVRLSASADINALLPVDTDASAIQRNVTLAENVTAPVKKGTVLGRVELRLADSVIANVDLIAAENVERSVWLYALDVTGRFLDQTLVKVLLLLLGLLIFIYIVSVIRYNQKRRRRMQRKHKTAVQRK